MILYKNITIYFNQIEFGPMNDDFPHITSILVILFLNITIYFNHIEFGSINGDFPHITSKLFILYEKITINFIISSLVHFMMIFRT